MQSNKYGPGTKSSWLRWQNSDDWCVAVDIAIMYFFFPSVSLSLSLHMPFHGSFSANPVKLPWQPLQWTKTDSWMPCVSPLVSSRIGSLISNIVGPSRHIWVFYFFQDFPKHPQLCLTSNDKTQLKRYYDNAILDCCYQQILGESALVS